MLAGGLIVEAAKKLGKATAHTHVFPEELERTRSPPWLQDYLDFFEHSALGKAYIWCPHCVEVCAVWVHPSLRPRQWECRSATAPCESRSALTPRVYGRAHTSPRFVSTPTPRPQPRIHLVSTPTATPTPRVHTQATAMPTPMLESLAVDAYGLLALCSAAGKPMPGHCTKLLPRSSGGCRGWCASLHRLRDLGRSPEWSRMEVPGGLGRMQPRAAVLGPLASHPGPKPALDLGAPELPLRGDNIKVWPTSLP